jgi:hypothetical protein
MIKLFKANMIQYDIRSKVSKKYSSNVTFDKIQNLLKIILKVNKIL